MKYKGPFVDPASIPHKPIAAIMKERQYMVHPKRKETGSGVSKFNYHSAMCSLRIRREHKLADIFFSKKNITYIHEQIINKTFQHTGKRIDKQDINVIFAAMRGVFREYEIEGMKGQHSVLQYLNNKVIDFISRDVIKNVRGYIAYMERISGKRQILSNPISQNKTSHQWQKHSLF